MGKSSEELRREIEETRYQLGGTLEAIGDRVSPGRIVERRKNRFTLGARNVKDRVMGTVSDAGHRVSDTAHHAVGGVQHAAGSVSDSTTSVASSAADTVRNLPQTARQQSQGNPLIAGSVAFGVGLLAAAALPASRKERQAAQQLMQTALPAVKEEVQKTAQEVAEHLKEPAMEAANEVKSVATDAATHVTEVAKDGVAQAKEAGTTQ